MAGVKLEVTAPGFVPKQVLHYEERILAPEEEVEIRLRVLESVHGRVVLGPDQERMPGVPVELLAEGKVLERTVTDDPRITIH